MEASLTNIFLWLEKRKEESFKLFRSLEISKMESRISFLTNIKEKDYSVLSCSKDSSRNLSYAKTLQGDREQETVMVYWLKIMDTLTSHTLIL